MTRTLPTLLGFLCSFVFCDSYSTFFWVQLEGPILIFLSSCKAFWSLSYVPVRNGSGGNLSNSVGISVWCARSRYACPWYTILHPSVSGFHPPQQIAEPANPRFPAVVDPPRHLNPIKRSKPSRRPRGNIYLFFFLNPPHPPGPPVQ